MQRLAIPAVILHLAVSTAVGDDTVVFDFEGNGDDAWTMEGEAFETYPARGIDLPVVGHRGRGLVSSLTHGDSATGRLTSPAFTISEDWVSLLVGGGRHPGRTGVELLVDGTSVHAATGGDSDDLHWQSWDVRPFRGKTARLRIYDRVEETWGHVHVDHVMLTEKPRTGAGTWRLESYRRSREYYRERYRPQFHFSPELNWCNDPNGLVYYKGEYHLFYQHNPLGRLWGHMSWGHAVSRDLVHWRHLPIALHEEYGVMIFSGCTVVDGRNTSGFGRPGRPPLIALYTGHGHGKQTQDLAYSLNRGRNWTKYADNPVLDVGERDFRDPKVFWHEPTERWIMVVSLAAKKVIRFYGSKDLREWTLLSDFGPAGVKDKPNWECPDLFELPIEGEPGTTRWVLEVDMGRGAIAGGSGGEYFVGHFDGERFRSDEPLDNVHWVDFGRDFYAPVSFANVPDSDGRRIWIGWMNNWETNKLPTNPWRGAMSIPRTLSLRQTSQGLRLVQTPVQELRSLRRNHRRIVDRSIAEGDSQLLRQEEQSVGLEIVAEFKLATATEFGIRVRTGGKDRKEQTVIGYDAETQELFVDRTDSGQVDFHPQFAGRHSGPLHDEHGRIRVHIFLDASSVEVFGNRGQTVITDRIFPSTRSRRIEAYSIGGKSVLKSVDVWQLDSIWPRP